MYDSIFNDETKAHIIPEFIEKITGNKKDHADRFYEVFSARGFLLEMDKYSGNIRLRKDSHMDDGEFLEILQGIDYKMLCQKPHQDAITVDSKKDDIQKRYHKFFRTIDSRLFPLDDNRYLTEIFTCKIPVDIFRLNWERDRYTSFEQFKGCDHLPEVRVYDLEPFIARLIKSVSSIGISTWSSCEGHCGEPAYINFDGRYHHIWFQAIFNEFIVKKINPVCNWEWLAWDHRCSIRAPDRDLLELYLEIQRVARLLYDCRDFLIGAKKQVCAPLTDKHKKMRQKDLLKVFEDYFGWLQC